MDDQALIQAAAAQKLGLPNVEAAAAAPAAPATAPTTKMEAATKTVAPSTEATTAKAQPFDFFEVDLGDGKKEVLSPEQIKSMTSRYKELNYKHQTEYAPMKDSISFLSQLRSQAAADGHEISDDDFNKFVMSAIASYAHNPAQGAQAHGQGPATTSPNRTNQPVDTKTSSVAHNANNMEAMLSQWEQENAVSLPPMYKEAIARTSGLESQINEMRTMMQQLAQGSKAAITTAADQVGAARQLNSQAGYQRIGNNLKQVQMKYQLPDDAEQPFMSFIQERGYLIEDLMDPTLADKLGSDFKSVMQTPDLERLKAVHAKRQAFTGTVAPSSSQGAASPAPAQDADQSFIDSVASEHMKKRNMV